MYRKMAVMLGGLLLVGMFVSVSAASCTWIFLGDNDRNATESLASFLEDHEVEIYYVSDYFLVVKDRFKVLLQPKMSDDGLDRIVAHVMFGVKNFYKGSTTIVRFVNRLNQKYNIGGFYIDEDGDLAFQTQLTFVDTLCWDELEAFITWVNKSLGAIVKEEEEDFTKYLE